MQIDHQRTRQYLKDFDFEPLFIEELGWDYHTQTPNIRGFALNNALDFCFPNF